MERPSVWLMLAIVLASLLFLREPRLQAYDEIFLRWLLTNSQPHVAVVPLTVVDIGREDKPDEKAAAAGKPTAKSPLEYSLFLQAAMEFKPTVIAFEPVLQWGEKVQDQEQIFIDQAMRVPKLLAGVELTATPDLDAPVIEIPGFTQVSGRRGDLPVFSGINRQPDEDIRIISTPGFVNLPAEVSSTTEVPMLFQYRGEVIPSFALQAALLWMRVTPAEVKIDIGSAINLPNGKKIPIRSDGTASINPNSAKRARHMTLNELLLAAQQHEKKDASAATFDTIRDDIVLARTGNGSQQSPGMIAAAIATIQTDSFVRRISWYFDCAFILALVIASGFVRRFSRIDIVLIALAITAAYCLAGLALISRKFIWLPGVLPLSAIWLVAVFCIFAPRSRNDPDLPTVVPPPPSL